MSIRAMNWAMEQETGDPRSQCLLYVIADCANPEGVAFPSIKFMAAKSQQSKATVQRRLKELEDMGAIARFPRWEDEGGKVNSEGRGRRTSDEIRVLLDAHIIRSSGDDDDGAGGPDSGAPPSQPDTPPSPGATGTVAQLSDGGPSHCGDPLMNLQKEPEDSPPFPPSGGDATAFEQFEESWSDFEKAWHEPILRQSIARTVWAALNEDERKLAIKAAAGYVVWRAGQKKPPNVINAHTFLRERDAWVRFAALAPADQAAAEKITIEADTPAWRGFCVIARIWGRPIPTGPVEVRARAVPGLQSLSEAYWVEDWPSIFECDQPRQAQAWRERLEKCGYQMPGAQKIDDGPHPTLGRAWKFGWLLPAEWPPRMDGTLSATGPAGEAS